MAHLAGQCPERRLVGLGGRAPRGPVRGRPLRRSAGQCCNEDVAAVNGAPVAFGGEMTLPRRPNGAAPARRLAAARRAPGKRRALRLRTPYGFDRDSGGGASATRSRPGEAQESASGFTGQCCRAIPAGRRAPTRTDFETRVPVRPRRSFPPPRRQACPQACPQAPRPAQGVGAAEQHGVEVAGGSPRRPGRISNSGQRFDLQPAARLPAATVALQPGSGRMARIGSVMRRPVKCAANAGRARGRAARRRAGRDLRCRRRRSRASPATFSAPSGLNERRAHRQHAPRSRSHSTAIGLWQMPPSAASSARSAMTSRAARRVVDRREPARASRSSAPASRWRSPPCAGAGSHSVGVERMADAVLAEPLRARRRRGTSHRASPAASLAMRVATLPRNGTTLQSGRAWSICAARRGALVPTRAPCGEARDARPRRAARRACRRAAAPRRSRALPGRIVSTSLSECTAASIRPSREPLVELAWSTAPCRRSRPAAGPAPCRRWRATGTSSTASSSQPCAAHSRARASCACARASGERRVPSLKLGSMQPLGALALAQAMRQGKAAMRHSAGHRDAAATRPLPRW